ncbi:serine/threonine-protein kinase [uncultured Streptomyces sp.]|uniref:serine/threonine-protein kinase n=1 Tax=uncultured Streptomyces sp. TaxID=174707 RepID=UPI0026309B84|nr:serine/threonine-protein kinase [uncultured Streptomyces sp.]
MRSEGTAADGPERGSGADPAGPSGARTPEPDAVLRPHTVIADRYELQRQLGSGGMGVVWEALDRRLGRLVAVKGLLYRGSVEPDTQAQWVARARREAQAIARIGHPNVVAVHDVIEADSQVWIVMELLNARSLADELRERRPLPVARAARIGLHVLRGLRAVHEAGVLHRDVKPHNILFRPNGRALLMDFGIATFEGAVQLTKSQEIIGTPKYLAPELIRIGSSEGGPASPASDLWSLGVTLYEMVEGQAPFTGLSSYEIFIAVIEEPVPVPRNAGPLAPVIEALLQKDPKLRPSAAEVEVMLQRVTGDPPADSDDTDDDHSQRRPALDEPPRPPRRGPSRKRRALLGAAVCCAVLAGGGWFVWDRQADTAPYKESHPILRIGVKADQPGLSELNAKTGRYEGYDVDLARAVGEQMGYAADEIKFTAVTSGDRADFLTDTGRGDLVIASYSITPERKAAGLDFAGPYYVAVPSFLVRTDKGREYGDASQLKDDDAVVCTASGSTYETYLPENHYTVLENLPTTYGACMRYLQDDDNPVAAVSTDDVILAGYARDNSNLRILKGVQGSERYGVAMKAGNPGLKGEVCAALRSVMADGTWDDLYTENLEPLMKTMGIDEPPDEPPLTECEDR